MEGPVTRAHLRAAAATLMLLLAIAAPACGSDGSDSKSGSNQSTTSDTSAKSYVGLTKKEAIAKAKAEGRQWRILREDDETFMATQDFVDTRINFEIDHGKVSKATYG
jgi:hypothetical protein